MIKKIFHVADIHIRNLKRHKEYRLVFERMFEEIRKRGTDDAIIYLAGDIAHAKLEMSPELIKEIAWLFTECSNHCKTILIAGNHDCNMNNADRLDVLSPIVEALNLPNFHYLKDTQIFWEGDIAFSVFSIFDKKENWPKADDRMMIPAKKKIALFHGPVDHSQTDIGYVVSSRHFTTEMFDGYDLALLGDIHKRQELISPKGCKIVYAGSLVQQSFGESVDRHGFLVWDLETLTYEEVDIKNDYGYYTLNVDNGIVPVVDDIPKYAHLRVKLSNTNVTTTKKVVMEIKKKYGIKDFTIIRTDSIAKLKTGNRINKLEFGDVTDVNYQNFLITDYLNRMLPGISEDDVETIHKINTDINSRIKPEDVYRNIMWKPIRFEFSNMFSYGESNKIDFSKINGLTGLFAPNASGKSSLFDAISFCLYDKCSRAFKATHIMNNRKTNFVCELHFEINGVMYAIRREAKTINKGKNVKVDVQFWKVENSMAISLNGTERRDTNTIIEQYVGRYEDFVLTALSVQGNNALFIDKSQSERKELLAQFMGLNVFDKLYEAANDDIKEVSALIKNFKKTDFTSEMNSYVDELSSNKTLLSDLENKFTECSKEKDDCISEILNKSRQLINVDVLSDIDTLRSKRDTALIKLNDVKDSKKSISDKIDMNRKYIDALTNEIIENETLNGLNIKDAKNNFDKLKDELNKIKHKAQLLNQTILANREKLSHLEKHEYDPNCKFCVNNVFVKDALATKEILEKQLIELDSLQNLFNSKKIELDAISDAEIIWKKYSELCSTLDKLISSTDSLEIELKGLNTTSELIVHKLEQTNLEIEKYFSNEKSINWNTQLEKEIKVLESKRDYKETELKSLRSMLNDVNNKITKCSTYIESFKSKIKEVKDLEEKYQMYEYYLDCIKKDGIPYELISKALPIIETEVNNILGQVVDFNILMDVDGKNINAKIVYDDQEWALEMSSGMERFISGIAIRVALINICNLPRPNFLVIDEGFGTLDSDNISSLFMMMQYLKTQFDFIWIISHLDQMRDMVDGIVEIKKVNGFSMINN